MKKYLKKNSNKITVTQVKRAAAYAPPLGEMKFNFDFGKNNFNKITKKWSEQWPFPKKGKSDQRWGTHLGSIGDFA